MAPLIVERATEGDLPRVLELMKELAEFEGYLAEFKLTQTSLHKALFVDHRCEVLLAKDSKQVLGLAVFYALPFTYDLKPWICLKELIVDENSRSRGVGRVLMQALIDIAKQRNAGRIKWDVLSSNSRAQNFYLSLGAKEDDLWRPFCLEV